MLPREKEPEGCMTIGLGNMKTEVLDKICNKLTVELRGCTLTPADSFYLLTQFINVLYSVTQPRVQEEGAKWHGKEISNK
jgi:hypothetical protein